MSSNGEDQPSKKMKPSTELPDHLIERCFAHASILNFPIISLVSKTYSSLLASPEFNQIRSNLGRNTESCLFVCLSFPPDLNLRWFTLCKRPNQTLTQEKKGKARGEYALAPFRIMNSPTVEWSGLIAVGHKLYAIDGAMEEEEVTTCSNVTFLDCLTHTWHEAPGMRISETDTIFDGMLYLPGTNENADSSLNCVEVFNKMTQTWNHLAPPEKELFKLTSLKGKIFTVLESAEVGLVYNPKESASALVRLDMNSNDQSCMCVIENIYFYYTSTEGFEWSHTKSEDSGKLQGLEEALPKFAHYSNVKLADYGGQLMVLWDKYVPSSGYKEKMIWCAEISLEKRKKRKNGVEIWGKVEWADAVLKVPKSYKFAKAITAYV